MLGLFTRFRRRMQQRLCFRPSVTEFESRIVPTVMDYFVTNGNDSGAGSLRQAYLDAIGFGPTPGGGNQARIIIDDAVAGVGGIELTSGPVITGAVNLTSLEIVTEGGVQVLITGTGGFRFMDHGGNNGISFTFSNLTFGEADVPATSFGAFAGLSDTGDGGIIRTVGNLTLNGCVFNDGVAQGSGGAIYTTSGLTLTSCAFVDNTATGSGGAIYSMPNGGAAGLTAADVEFVMNDSLEGSGGAIYYQASVGTLNLTDFFFTGNVAGLRGGAVYQVGGFFEAIGGSFAFNTDGTLPGATGEFASELYLFSLYGVNVDAFIFTGASPDNNAVYLYDEVPPSSPALSRFNQDTVFGFIDTNWTLSFP